MLNIFTIFEENSLLPLFNALPELKDIDTLVWYPSSGYDYRHIFSDLISETDKRKIYLHTDISALNYNFDSLKDENPLFKKKRFLAQYDTFVTCLDFFELILKSDYYHPSYDVLYKGFGDKGMYNGRVFCFLINIGFDEAKIVPLIFAAFENTNFFYDYILESKIQIQELIHVNDGGQSMGSSKFKMDFIYLNLDSIGVQKIKLDYSIETKFEHAVYDFGHFRYYSPLKRNKNTEERKTEFYSREFVQIESKKWEDKNLISRSILRNDKNNRSQYEYLYERKKNAL